MVGARGGRPGVRMFVVENCPDLGEYQALLSRRTRAIATRAEELIASGISLDRLKLRGRQVDECLSLMVDGELDSEYVVLNDRP